VSYKKGKEEGSDPNSKNVDNVFLNICIFDYILIHASPIIKGHID